MTTALATKQEQNVSIESGKASDRLVAFKGYLSDNRDSISALLPKSVPFDTFQEVSIAAIEKRPELLNCGRSLFTAAKTIAQMGLYPDGKEAHIEVRNTKTKDANGRDVYLPTAVAMPMGYGFNKLALEAGYSVTTGVVCENDKFEFDPINDFKPKLKVDWTKPRGNAALYYAVFDPNDGTKPIVEIVSEVEMARIRKCAKTDNVWANWTDEKSRNAVLKRGAKRINLSGSRLWKAIEVDNEDFDLEKLNAPPPKSVSLPTNLSEDWIPIADQSNNEEDVEEIYGVADYSHDVGLAKTFDELVSATTKLITSPPWIDLKAQGQANVLKNITGPATKEIGLPEFDALAEVNDSIYLCVMWGTDSKEILNNVDDLLLKQEGQISPDILAIKAIRIAELKTGKKADEPALI